MSDETNPPNSQPMPERRGPGRPRKVSAGADREPIREPKQWKMRAKPNWETFDATAEDSPDRLRINPELIPEGMSAVWVTDSVYGQQLPQHRADFERKGWTPVHQDDFDGQFDGMFMPKGKEGEINTDGLVLMMRPKEMTDKAKRNDLKRAREQVSIKEQSLRSGDLPVSLDSQHQSALNSNRISKSYERISIPKDE